MDYDESRIYYSYQNLQTNTNNERIDDTSNRVEEDTEDLDLDNVNLHAVKRHFREFLREFQNSVCLSTHRFFMILLFYSS